MDLGQDVLISTFPQDADGTVDRAEIYEGNKLVGTVNISPYKITWTPSNIQLYPICHSLSHRRCRRLAWVTHGQHCRTSQCQSPSFRNHC
ncbi:hypothetical protein JYB62_02010 [Algoriphagus lutimaris]|nr:hypothetical protein [Algoriphagus lutimaris]